MIPIALCILTIIYAVYLQKADIPALYRPSKKEGLYISAINELLNIIPLNEARIVIDGSYSKEYSRYLKSYIRKNLNSTEQRRIQDFRIIDSRKNNLIQLADIVAGSINRYLQPGKTDSMVYISLFKNRIRQLKRLDLTNL